MTKKIRDENVMWEGESIWQDIRPGDTIALPQGSGLVLAVPDGPLRVWDEAHERMRHFDRPVLVLVEDGRRWEWFDKTALADEPVLSRAEEATIRVVEARLKAHGEDS